MNPSDFKLFTGPGGSDPFGGCQIEVTHAIKNVCFDPHSGAITITISPEAIRQAQKDYESPAVFQYGLLLGGTTPIHECTVEGQRHPFDAYSESLATDERYDLVGYGFAGSREGLTIYGYFYKLK